MGLYWAFLSTGMKYLSINLILLWSSSSFILYTASYKKVLSVISFILYHAVANWKHNTSVLFGVLLFPLSIFLHSCQDCFAKQYTGTYTFFSGSTFWRTHAQKMDNKYGLMKASLVLSSLTQFTSVQSLSHVWLFVTPCTAALQASLSITNSRVYPNSCSLSWWCHPTISSSVVPFFSCLQSFPALGSFQMSQLFASGGQSTGVSALAPVLPMNTQDWSPLGWTGWISLQSKGLSRVFSNTTVQKHQFFGPQLSL